MAKNAAERRRKAEERRIQREREERRRRFLRISAFSVTGVVLAGLVGFGVWVAYDRGQQRDPATIEGLRTFDDLTNNHVTEPVDYEQTPPAGGDHHAVWQNCGVYDAPVSTMNAVHSLEHGAVWITYEPDLPEDQVEQLASLYSQGSYVLVSPYEDGDMPSPIVASAWGNQIRLDSPEDERLSRFLRAFERSPNVPEPGAACSGGLNMNAQELEEAGGLEALNGGM
ncbi:DUF3105 domain-containing protein [Streptomonospora nanhaiensis]|uniref:DUF3105 domain-containing protein n=1 Tax=Streptomonospora nanhaiensis TaxID=1323731 RepID=A0A853BRN8_9ACTN|nr:DUF3105 domain-containing protein [Streptomonospora nanhaiensis]MBV2362595.1 DUF3105 domain-containing protein [Streptomonospora nanhaiensis]MBX9386874.1 DUF3105 domain-containing protein [Streptomonospora nanhaiensis]NYI98058.1 hypothetical protein [Streptomonospora nanhaiensis]